MMTAEHDRKLAAAIAWLRTRSRGYVLDKGSKPMYETKAPEPEPPPKFAGKVTPIKARR